MALAMIAHVPGHDGSHVVSEPAGLGMAGHEVVRVVHEN
jgi:hypothetical protein